MGTVAALVRGRAPVDQEGDGLASIMAPEGLASIIAPDGLGLASIIAPDGLASIIVLPDGLASVMAEGDGDWVAPDCVHAAKPSPSASTPIATNPPVRWGRTLFSSITEVGRQMMGSPA